MKDFKVGDWCCFAGHKTLVQITDIDHRWGGVDGLCANKRRYFSYLKNCEPFIGELPFFLVDDKTAKKII